MRAGIQRPSGARSLGLGVLVGALLVCGGCDLAAGDDGNSYPLPLASGPPPPLSGHIVFDVEPPVSEGLFTTA